MRITKAIEILTIHNDHNPNFTDADRRAAHQLGIEAMKLVAECRQSHWARILYLLPGETKD